MSYEKEREVYVYVKQMASEYLPTILQAITDGINDENQSLRHRKAKVECGLVVLAEKVNLSKLDEQMHSVLVDALENCTFLKMDSFLTMLSKKE